MSGRGDQHQDADAHGSDSHHHDHHGPGCDHPSHNTCNGEDENHGAADCGHDHSPDDPLARTRLVVSLLILAAALGLGIMWNVAPDSARFATVIFLGIVLEAAPWIVLAAIMAVGLELFLKDNWLPAMARRCGWWGLPLVALAAPLIPTCECGVVVVTRSLVRKGLPPAHAITFLLAAPVLNPLVMLTTGLAFADPMMAVWRTLFAFVVAVFVGATCYRLTPQETLVGSLQSTDGHAHHVSHAHGGPGLSGKAERVLADLFDTMIFFVFGVAIAAGLRTGISTESLNTLGSDPMLAPLVTMTFAFIASLCSEADAFLAAGLTGFAVGPLLAFMVFGPMCDIKLLLMVRVLLKPRIIARVMLTTAALVWLIAVLIGVLT